MSYWSLLEESRRHLTAGDFLEAERLYFTATDSHRSSKLRAPLMEKGAGQILILTSASSEQALSDFAGYSAMRAAANTLIQCAAMTAAENGASVLILESAPKTYRGGNSRHTRNFRCMHEKPMSVLVEAYKEDEYFEDLLKVTGGNTDENLARLFP